MKWTNEIPKVVCRYNNDSWIGEWICNCPTCKKEWFYTGNINTTHVCDCGTNFMLIIDENERSLTFEELINNG